MKKIFNIIKYNPLFKGIDYGDFEKMFNCIDSKTKIYDKDDIIMMSGDSVSFIGIILSGGVKILKEDIDGNVMIITELASPEIFGETLACAEIERSPVTVRASEKSEVLFIGYKKIIGVCSNICGFHSRLIENMLRLIAKKNLMLNQKIEILSKRTTREKLIAFFDAQRGAARKFAIPYNREELAHYLFVDRSAMSNELSKMRDEGLIEFKKNAFEVLY